MFESAELGHRIDRDTYRREEPALREALLDAQFDLMESKAFQVIILVGGVDGAGKGETVNLLNEWMDPRQIRTTALGDPSDEEQARPPMWRFWRALPPRGSIGIFFHSWYSPPINDRVSGRTKDADLDKSIAEINRFEEMLAAEGALILKFWFHLTKKGQKKRLEKLEKDPRTRWRVTSVEWERLKTYDAFHDVAERTLRKTNTEHAPWTFVEGEDERYRSLTVGKAILHAVRQRLDEAPVPTRAQVPPNPPALDGLTVLSTLDLSKKLKRDEYRDLLEKYEGRLSLLTRDSKFKNQALVVVFEGNDAAGKGGAIRRVTSAMDARLYHVVPVAAPTDEERAQPYLWRFWRNLPRLGHVAIFDRSWYGRVLVERVQGFCSEADWMRAYHEINQFEEEMHRHGIVVAKFWLTISKEEQEARFKEREETDYKRFKLTEEDWRNRERWDDYAAAVCDMVDRTSTKIAPWILVEASDKYFARIKVLRSLCERIEAAA